MSTAVIELDHPRYGTSTSGRHRLDVAEGVAQVVDVILTSKALFEQRMPRWPDGGERFIRHTAARIHSHRRGNFALTMAKVSIALVGVMLAAAL